MKSKTTCENDGSWPTTRTFSSPWASSSAKASVRENPLASECSTIGSMFKLAQASVAVSHARTFGLA